MQLFFFFFNLRAVLVFFHGAWYRGDTNTGTGCNIGASASTHRIIQVGKDLWRSSSQTSCSKQASLDQVARGFV